MDISFPKIHLALAWVLILLGFISGMLMGLRFHNENWLGGYASHKRRLYRLGHISFFGLAMINLLFYFTAQHFPAARWSVIGASWGMIVGAVTMPACCAIMAHSAKCRMLFAVPVISLLVGGSLTLWEVIKL